MSMRNTLKVATPTDREIVITREFDAPRELVWDTMSKPELLILRAERVETFPLRTIVIDV
jgi:hypothetical protein